MFNKQINFSVAFLLQFFLQKKYLNIKLIDYGLHKNGFYCDFILNDKNIKKIDLEELTNNLLSYIKNKKKIVLKNGQVYYEEFSGIWKDISIEPSVEFNILKLLNISTLTNKENLKQKITRLVGVAFVNDFDYQKYQKQSINIKKQDHRYFGAELCLFDQDLLIGQGLPIWLNDGYYIKKKITEIINKIQLKYGVELVSTPVLGSKELYITSGHWEHYQKSIFPPISLEDKEYILRPMTCPHHIVLFKLKQHSYRDLPYYIGENSILHRYESSGGLLGLERVRSMELIDTHVFLTDSQVYEVFKQCYLMIKEAAKIFDISFHDIHLAVNDETNKVKFYDDLEMWQNSQKQLIDFLVKENIKYELKVGEAAFYGPKIDFQVKTILSKIITIATIQLDFLLPKKFDLKYKNNLGNFVQPVMIHLGIIGTLERFFALLLEQKQGQLPFWLLPKQVVLIPLRNKHTTYAEELNQELKTLGIMSFVDNSAERLTKKILINQKKKIPYLIVIGDQEIADSNIISYRCNKTQINTKINKKEFIVMLQNLNQKPTI